jgi:hypothetical protein
MKLNLLKKKEIALNHIEREEMIFVNPRFFGCSSLFFSHAIWTDHENKKNFSPHQLFDFYSQFQRPLFYDIEGSKIYRAE